MIWSTTDPSKNVSKKIPPKIHHKTVQSNILWLDLNKICAISILQSAHKQGNPSFHFFLRRAQNADTHALEQPRLSQNMSPVCTSFVLVIASDMHLESESEKRAKNVDLHTAKKSPASNTRAQLQLMRVPSLRHSAG